MEARSVSRILSRDHLIEKVDAARRQGLSVIFANGCFDLLHVGHVRYLQAAAAEADRLVVAINADSSAATKGPGRPILAEAVRAELVPNEEHAAKGRRLYELRRDEVDSAEGPG